MPSDSKKRRDQKKKEAAKAQSAKTTKPKGASAKGDGEENGVTNGVEISEEGAFN